MIEYNESIGVRSAALITHYQLLNHVKKTAGQCNFFLKRQYELKITSRIQCGHYTSRTPAEGIQIIGCQPILAVFSCIRDIKI